MRCHSLPKVFSDSRGIYILYICFSDQNHSRLWSKQLALHKIYLKQQRRKDFLAENCYTFLVDPSEWPAGLCGSCGHHRCSETDAK